jgi:hypothetical protein
MSFLLATAFVGSYGAINPILNYQGSLTDSNNVPYSDGTHQLTFRIYADSVAGVALWAKPSACIKWVGAYLSGKQSFPGCSKLPLYLESLTIATGPDHGFIAASVYTFLARNSQNLGGYPASHFADSGKIATAVAGHNADVTAHHPMRIDAAEIVSGVFDPNRIPPWKSLQRYPRWEITTSDLANSLSLANLHRRRPSGHIAHS